MSKSVSVKSITAAATAAAFLAGLALFLTSIAPEAKAGSEVGEALPRPLAKSDSAFPSVKGAACSERSWPYYAPSCQFDLRRPADAVPTIRVIALR